MKSKTSFFNPGLCRSLLRRNWPVWASYFAVLFFMVPANLMSITQYREYRNPESAEFLYNNLNRSMLEAGPNAVILSFFACALVAMAMYSFMYNSRSTSMYCSLPIRRETVYTTAFITGLVPMLISDLIIALFCFAFLSGEGMIEAENIWKFLAMAVMGNICFFGFAAFCSVLTGNLFILPAVYGVLNVAVLLAESGIQAALNTIVYGYSYSDTSLGFLSPIGQLAHSLSVESVYERVLDGGMRETGEYILHGMGILAIYCAVGLVFAFFGLLLYRRRRMETVSDVVSIPVLKPVFKYCMCFGVSLCFAAAMYDMVFARSFTAETEAIACLALMLVGAFIGYFVAEMLMQKTLRVFRGQWKGFLVSCLIICAFIGIAEFDLSGYEKRLPDLDEVEYVSLSYYDGGTFHEEENISAAHDLHRLLIDSKYENEHADNLNWIYLSYFGPDDSLVLTRRFPMSFDLAQKRDAASPVNALGRIINVQEAIISRATTVVPVTEYNIMDAHFSTERIREDGEREHYSFKLSAQQAAEFYNECILPDAMDGKLCRVFPVENEEYFSQATPVVFSFSIFNKSQTSFDDWYHNYYDFTMYLDAQRCCKWIEENTDIELISIGDREPERRDEMLHQLYYGTDNVNSIGDAPLVQATRAYP